ncbi:MAG: DUF222 domain-containing protein [Hamadaea sp.]|nr:DUF222 domain-containing protein [Hamadaea sp.]
MLEDGAAGDLADPLGDASSLDGGSRLDALCAIARVVAGDQARLLEAMASVAATSTGIGFDADEVAFALCLPRVTAQNQVALALDLTRRLPQVLAALRAGRVCLARARVFSDVLTPACDDVARELADRFLPPAEVWTASQLRSRLLKALLDADPSAARTRYERSIEERRVSLSHNDDTTACLSGIFLPPVKAAAAFERVDAIARGLKRDGEARTLEHPAVAAAAGGVVAPRPTVQWRYGVHDNDGSLLHQGVTRARPSGEVDRVPPADGGPENRRAGAGSANGRERRPTNGGLVFGATLRRHNRANRSVPCPPVQDDDTARFPSAPLRRWVIARDVTCRAPGCTAPARSCDTDHTIDHADGGRTRHDNLGLLCRHHHRLKHEGGFQLAQPEPGHFHWTSPNGRTYEALPEPP